jgi:hypothetical protein
MYLNACDCCLSSATTTLRHVARLLTLHLDQVPEADMWPVLICPLVACDRRTVMLRACLRTHVCCCQTRMRWSMHSRYDDAAHSPACLQPRPVLVSVGHCTLCMIQGNTSAYVCCTPCVLHTRSLLPCCWCHLPAGLTRCPHLTCGCAGRPAGVHRAEVGQ